VKNYQLFVSQLFRRRWNLW